MSGGVELLIDIDYKCTEIRKPRRLGYARADYEKDAPFRMSEQQSLRYRGAVSI